VRNQKFQLLPIWCVCQPWICESECLSTIPFARNTDANAHILSQLDTLKDAAARIGTMISSDSVHDVLTNKERDTLSEAVVSLRTVVCIVYWIEVN